MTDDQLAAEYLKRLRRAAGGLPRARRRELLEAIQAHIAEARAAGAVPLRDVLDDLGEPGEIAAAAGGGMRAGAGGHQIAAVVLLLAGGRSSSSAGSPGWPCCGHRTGGAGTTNCSAPSCGPAAWPG